jgi:acetyltransferase-like isoleucine patch superfamily enzyme
MVPLWDHAARTLSAAAWSAWARWVLMLQGCAAGPGLRADGHLRIRVGRAGAIRIGKGFMANSRPLSNLVGMPHDCILCCYDGGRITIGDHSGMSGAVLSARAHIHIGDHVNIGGGVRIYDHDFHSLDAADRRDPVRNTGNCRSEPVTIGNDVFIGAGAIVLKGVTVGDRTIIGAGAVVTLRDIPPDSVVAGNPARILDRRDA